METLINAIRFIPNEQDEAPLIGDFYLGVFATTRPDDPNEGSLAIWIGEDQRYIHGTEAIVYFLNSFPGGFVVEQTDEGDE